MGQNKIPDHVSKTLTVLTKRLLIVGDTLWSFGGPLQVVSGPQDVSAREWCPLGRLPGVCRVVSAHHGQRMRRAPPPRLSLHQRPSPRAAPAWPPALQGPSAARQGATPLPVLLATLQPNQTWPLSLQVRGDRASSRKGSVLILLTRGSEPNACLPRGEEPPCGQSHGPAAPPASTL